MLLKIPDWLGYLSSVATALEVLLPDCLLNPVHLVLVALSVPHRPLFGLLQGSLKSLMIKSFKYVSIVSFSTHFDPLHGGSEPLLKFGQFTPEVGIISDQLLVDLSQLIQVIFKEGNFLFLSKRTASVLGFFSSC